MCTVETDSCETKFYRRNSATQIFLSPISRSAIPNLHNFPEGNLRSQNSNFQNHVVQEKSADDNAVLPKSTGRPPSEIPIQLPGRCRARRKSRNPRNKSCRGRTCDCRAPLLLDTKPDFYPIFPIEISNNCRSKNL